MQKWKVFHPPGKKENKSGTVGRRGKENTVVLLFGYISFSDF